jgi:maltose O-acetyltransferase
MIVKQMLRKLYYIRDFYKFKTYGNNITLSAGGKFIRPEEIEFGENVFIGRNFHISARNLKIGNNIMIGPNLVIECDNHKYDVVGYSMYSQKEYREGNYVHIEDDVWIGASVIVLSNVIIGGGSIIGAGSVVTKSIPPYCIAVGNPCRPIKKRFSAAQLNDHLIKIKSKYTYDVVKQMWNNFNI